MRALRIWTDIAEWRWTPAVGLALGALSYVSLALLVIPDQIGDDARKTSIGTFQSLRNRNSAFAASIAPSLTDSEASRTDSVNAIAPTPPSPQPVAHVDESNFPRRGFTPPLERVEPAPPPPPPPPPAPEIVVQPPPPPPAAEAPPAPPPAPPAEAQAVAAPVPPPTPDQQPQAQPQPQPAPAAAAEPGQPAPPVPPPQQ